MKNDSSRFTFDARKHFRSVLMQQGRVQLDADSNEQGEIITHRVETETADIIGLCGGPLHYPAFHIVADLTQLTAEERKLAGNQAAPSGFKVPDFLISAGRYYVDGILCENEQLTSYLNQPDLLKAPPVKDAGLYLIYVDVWERLLTSLDDPSIRETALGGPDTATRRKNIWQVKYLFLGPAANGNCLTKFPEYEKLIAPSDGRLSARTEPGQTSTNPCIVPPGAGYRGLENQLYRVEIHQGGRALDVTSGGAGTPATRVPKTSDQVKYSGGAWQAGQAIEVFSSKAGSDVTNGTPAYVTKINTGSKTLTLDIDVSRFALDELRLRKAEATYKWSRDNGATVTTIESINSQDHKEITVHDVGPDAVLGFNVGQWVEITDDVLELNGQPGQLAQIVEIEPAINLIKLNVDASLPNGLDPKLHLKLRSWDGVGVVKFHPSLAADYFLDLENGVQVRFFDGSFKTGDYWTIAARTANADAQSGNIEWPQDQTSNNPLAQLAFGIEHHYCRLAMLRLATRRRIEPFITDETSLPETREAIVDGGIILPGTRFDIVEDCRNLFPPITELTSMFYLSGGGQEVMPDLTQPTALLPLAQSLIVGVARGSWPVSNAKVRFHVTKGNGKNFPDGAGVQVDPTTVDVRTDQDGLARCIWHIDSITQSQQLRATLFDADDKPVHLPITFTANVSDADHVAYDPGACTSLEGQKTVQKALSRLAQLMSLYKISGDGQRVTPGETLAPLRVQVSSLCGPIRDQDVTFQVIPTGGPLPGGAQVGGAGTVSDGVAPFANLINIKTDVHGIATCLWRPHPSTPFQEVEATIAALQPTIPPVRVRFHATIDLGGCEITVGKGGQFETLGGAFAQMRTEKKTDICICLLPGDHVLEGGLTIAFNAVESPVKHVKITGCGRGSRILLPSNPTRAPLKAIDLDSFVLRDVEIVAHTFIAFERCADVMFAGCDLKKQNEVAPFITIAGAKRIRFEGNVVLASAPLTAIPNFPGGIIEGTELSSLPKARNQVEFDQKASEVATTLTGMSAAKRKSLAKKLQKSIKGFDDLTPDQVTGFNNLTESLTAKTVDASKLQENLGVIAPTILMTVMGVAIVIQDAADTWLEDNDINGIVSLYGAPGGPRLTAAQMTSISRVLQQGAILLRGIEASLHIRDNIISLMTVSETTLSLLRQILPTVGIPPQPGAGLTKLYRRGFITDNVFRLGSNDFVMEHLALTSNSFEGNPDAGVVVANAAIYVGNYASNDIRLFNVARTNSKAANLTINIVDT